MLLRFKALSVALLTAAFVAFGVGSAFAGEVTGPGGSGRYIQGSNAAPLNGNSSCAYSGLNDNYVFGTAGPGNPDADGFTRTQAWGQLDQATRAFLTSIGSNPGVACNPTQATGGA
jgi:hypothetical protein